MRIASRWIAALVCAVLMLTPAWAEETAEAAPDATASLPVPEGETLIAPAYPVPDYVLSLLDVARQELGYTEAKNGATKYGIWTGDPTAEWCAEFLCWCVDQVDKTQQTRLLSHVYPNYSGNNTGRNWFLSQGRYIARKGVVPGWGTQWYPGDTTPMAPNSYIPQPGDWMFFSDNSLGDTTHVSMVEYCTEDASGGVWVHVIEGNNVHRPAPQSVERNVYALNDWAILGYGTVRDLAEITLRFGNDGEKTRALQAELAAAGFLEPRYTTGRYRYITEDAVKAVQRQCGIVETGIANHETRLALRVLVEKAAAEGEN